MKKVLLLVLVGMMFAGDALAVDPSSLRSAETGAIKLPSPQKTIGKPLMEVIGSRRTVREFSDKPMDLQTLSNLLWATFGISSEDGKRTIPTARNKQNLKVYALLKSGSYFYDAKANRLEPVSGEDIRGKSGSQSNLLKGASVILVFVEEAGDRFNMYNTGAASQNASLFAESEGWNSLVVGSFHEDVLRQALNINKDEEIKMIQAVGK